MRAPILLFVLTLASSSVNAGWFSEALQGRAPPAPDIAPCVISPGICAANEARKEDQRQHQIEDENRRLKESLTHYQQIIRALINEVQIKSDDERRVIRSVLNDAEICVAQATSLRSADYCISQARRQIQDVHRKYASGSNQRPSPSELPQCVRVDFPFNIRICLPG